MHYGEYLSGKSCFQIGFYIDSSFFSELLEPIKQKETERARDELPLKWIMTLFKKKKVNVGTSGVVQWLGIFLSM